MILLLTFFVFAALAPRWIKKLRQARQRRLLAGQLRQSLQTMVHGLRVGLGFQQSLEYAAREAQEPLALEWKRLQQTIRVGQPISEGLSDLSRRVPIKEMGWFVAAVQITQNTGGSLADVLDTLAATLQEQQALREKIGALTAQGKASGMLLSALPFLVLAALYVIAPEMVRPLFTTWLGQAMIAGVIVLVSLGGVVIAKIVAVKVD